MIRQYEYTDYSNYIDSQVKFNKEDPKSVWIKEETVKKIYGIAPDGIRHIMCHGSKTGAEQALFRKYYPTVGVIGTDLANVAETITDTVIHDFHESRDEWVDKFDIIYTNSWCHSFNPKKALSTWREQLTTMGILFLEYDIEKSTFEPSDETPLIVDGEGIRKLMNDAGLKYITMFNTHGGANSLCLVYMGSKR